LPAVASDAYIRILAGEGLEEDEEVFALVISKENTARSDKKAMGEPLRVGRALFYSMRAWFQKMNKR
jgi:hypothetical protein